MGGKFFDPRTTRSNVNTAAMPGLTGGIEDLMKGFMKNGMQGMPFGQASGLQQQVGNQWGGIVNNLGSMGGQGVIDAAQPVWARNQQMQADQLRQAGPRFNSNTERLVGEGQTRGLQDFNLFAQQAMQAGQQNQLNAMQGAGNYANQQQQGQDQWGQQMLGMLGQYGVGAPVITQGPSPFQNTMQMLGTGASIAGSFMGMPSAGGMGGGGGPSQGFQAWAQNLPQQGGYQPRPFGQNR